MSIVHALSVGCRGFFAAESNATCIRNYHFQVDHRRVTRKGSLSVIVTTYCFAFKSFYLLLLHLLPLWNLSSCTRHTVPAKRNDGTESAVTICFHVILILSRSVDMVINFQADRRWLWSNRETCKNDDDNNNNRSSGGKFPSNSLGLPFLDTLRINDWRKYRKQLNGGVHFDSMMMTMIFVLFPPFSIRFTLLCTPSLKRIGNYGVKILRFNTTFNE